MAAKGSLGAPPRFSRALAFRGRFQSPGWQNKTKNSLCPDSPVQSSWPINLRVYIWCSAFGMKPTASPSLLIANNARKKGWCLDWIRYPASVQLGAGSYSITLDPFKPSNRPLPRSCPPYRALPQKSLKLFRSTWNNDVGARWELQERNIFGVKSCQPKRKPPASESSAAYAPSKSSSALSPWRSSSVGSSLW